MASCWDCIDQQEKAIMALRRQVASLERDKLNLEKAFLDKDRTILKLHTIKTRDGKEHRNEREEAGGVLREASKEKEEADPLRRRQNQAGGVQSGQPNQNCGG